MGRLQVQLYPGIVSPLFHSWGFGLLLHADLFQKERMTTHSHTFPEEREKFMLPESRCDIPAQSSDCLGSSHVAIPWPARALDRLPAPLRELDGQGFFPDQQFPQSRWRRGWDIYSKEEVFVFVFFKQKVYKHLFNYKNTKLNKTQS